MSSNYRETFVTLLDKDDEEHTFSAWQVKTIRSQGGTTVITYLDADQVVRANIKQPAQKVRELVFGKMLDWD